MRRLRPVWVDVVERAEHAVMGAAPDRVLAVLAEQARTAHVVGMPPGHLYADARDDRHEDSGRPPRGVWLASLLLATIVGGADARSAARVIGEVAHRSPRTDQREAL